MQGYPRYINTKADIDYVIDNFPGDSRTTEFLQSLLTDRYGWYPVGKLVDGADGTTDDTHKVVDLETEPGITERWQYELRENPTARIFRMGLTVAEAEALLNG